MCNFRFCGMAVKSHQSQYKGNSVDLSDGISHNHKNHLKYQVTSRSRYSNPDTYSVLDK